MKRLHQAEILKLLDKVNNLWYKYNKSKNQDDYNLLLFYILKLSNYVIDKLKNINADEETYFYYLKLRNIRNKIAHNEKISKEEIKYIIVTLKNIIKLLY